MLMCGFWVVHRGDQGLTRERILESATSGTVRAGELNGCKGGSGRESKDGDDKAMEDGENTLLQA